MCPAAPLCVHLPWLACSKLEHTAQLCRPAPHVQRVINRAALAVPMHTWQDHSGGQTGDSGSHGGAALSSFPLPCYSDAAMVIPWLAPSIPPQPAGLPRLRCAPSGAPLRDPGGGWSSQTRPSRIHLTALCNVASPIKKMPPSDLAAPLRDPPPRGNATWTASGHRQCAR